MVGSLAQSNARLLYDSETRIRTTMYTVAGMSQGWSWGLVQ